MEGHYQQGHRGKKGMYKLVHKVQKRYFKEGGGELGNLREKKWSANSERIK